MLWDEVIHDLRQGSSDKLLSLDSYHKVYDDQLKVLKKQMGIHYPYHNHMNQLLSGIFEYFNEKRNPLQSVENQKYLAEAFTHASMTIGDMIEIEEYMYIMTGEGFKLRTKDDKLVPVPKFYYNSRDDVMEIIGKN
jgi:hypothetical protein